MKKFLFLIALFTLMGGANSVKADDVVEDLTASMFKQWSTTDADAIVTNPDATGVVSWGFDLGTALGEGGLVCGTGSVNGLVYADLSQYTKMTFTGTPGAGKENVTIRILYNREGAAGANQERQVTITSGTPVDFSIKDLGLTYFHLVAIKIAWGNAGSVSSIKLTKPSDPLEVPKENLRNAINLGNMYSPFGKTASSFAVLTSAISDGETELENGSATEESLNDAKLAITNAIAGLKLKDGYTNLTKGMANKDVDYVLFSSTGLAYGTGGVDMNTYAELNEFDQFIVLASAGKPRFCMNRKTADGQIGADLASSNMIDINTQGDYAGYTWATDKYQTIDGNKYTVDLNLIAADWNGLAKLHCIKGANYGNVTVTDMLLYRTINVGSTGYATFGSLYKSAKPNGVTAYAAKYEDGQVTLNPVTNVPAGKGVVIMGDEDSYAPTFDVEADDIDSDLKVSNGTVVGDGSTIYVLNKVADKVGFYLLKAGNTLEAGKAYLKIEDGVAKARAFIGISGMDVTGISTVKQAADSKDDVIYNLNGQRVSNPTKGVFIKNGVKFLVD